MKKEETKNESINKRGDIFLNLAKENDAGWGLQLEQSPTIAPQKYRFADPTHQ